MLGASAFPVAVDKLEVGPGQAPAKQYGYKHLFVGVVFHAQPLTMFMPACVMPHTMP